MTTNLVVKEVTFNNVTLIGVQKDGKIYVAVKKICDDLGLDSNNQIKKLKSHTVLSKGVVSITLPSKGGNQETYCIEHKYLANWLMAISPNKCKKEIRGLLESFQEKASDVLYEAFFGNKKQEQPKLPQSYEEALEHLLKQVKHNKKLESELKQTTQKVEELTPLAVYAQNSFNFIQKVPLSVFGKYLSEKVKKLGRNKISEFLIEQKLVFRNRQRILEPYSQYLKCDSKSQYFNLKPVKYKKPVYVITNINDVLTKTQVSEEEVVAFQILILKSGMEKVIELAYKSGLITNAEYFNVINDLPKWCNDVHYNHTKEFQSEINEVI